jgi:hypothetical protein
MAIGSTINESIATAGTTVHALAKTRDGQYTKTLTVNSEPEPIVLSLRAASPSGRYKTFGLTHKYAPSNNDSGTDPTSGSVTVAINVNASVGAVLTRDEILNHLRYALSAANASGVFEALFDGSYQ